MAESAGMFGWYDLMTTDLKAAAEFYGRVVGWTAADTGMTDRSYWILSMGTRSVGGLMNVPQEAADRGLKPCWMSYLMSADVDAATTELKSAGGSVSRGPEDIPGGIGRFAVVSDPQGATFVLFQNNGPSPSPAQPNEPGLVGWHELHTSDVDQAFAFYQKQFGFATTSVIDMGPMGSYLSFATGGTEPVGGMVREPGQPAHWLLYFNVADIDAAADKVRDAGGTVVMGPVQVPTKQWILLCVDPQGAAFALVAPKHS